MECSHPVKVVLTLQVYKLLSLHATLVVQYSSAVYTLVTVKEPDSEVAVVHGCFTEGGDSILGAFFWSRFIYYYNLKV